MTREWNGSTGVGLGAVAILGRVDFATHFGSSHFCSNDVLLSRAAQGFLISSFAPRSAVAQCHAGDGLPPSTPSGWHDAVRGTCPQPVQLSRRQQRHSSKQWHGQWPAVSESWGIPTRRRWSRGSATCSLSPPVSSPWYIFDVRLLRPNLTKITFFRSPHLSLQLLLKTALCFC